jgi:hypothetical protein
MDEEIRQAIEQTDTADWQNYNPGSHKDIKVVIRNNINSVCANYVAIGYYLNVVNDRKFYEEDGYSGIGEYAAAEYGITKDRCSFLMKIADKFCIPNSPALLPEYRDFKVEKLRAMLYLTDEQLEQVTITTTRAEIREMRKPTPEKVEPAQLEPEPNIYATSHKEPESPKPSYLKCAAYDFNKFGKGCSGCFYDMAENNCPYDRTDYFAEIKRREEQQIRFSVLREMCNSICKSLSYILEKNKYSMETIQGLSRGAQDFSFGFGDDGRGHSKYVSWYKSKTNSYLVEELNGSGKWTFEAGEVDQDIWNFNSRDWRNKQQEMTEQPEAVNDTQEPENNVDETVDNESDIVDEPDPVETVEADIVQTEPEELPKPVFTAMYHLKEAIAREELQIAQLGETWKAKQPDTFLKHQTILIALKCYLTDMEYPAPVPVKPTQPELPILKNNDQRKEFIEAYETWPIWIDQKETGERYYRYDLTDKVAMVVKVSLRHVWDHRSNKSEPTYSAPQYYLLGIKADYSTKVTFTEDDTRTFYECSSNMTMLVDYLKDFQKK